MPLLKTLGLSRPDPKPSDAPGEAPAPSSESPGAGLPEALAQWQATRATVIARLGQLNSAIQAAGHPASKEAVILIRAIQSNLSARPDTAQAVAELERYLTTDDVVAEAEAPNGFGIEVDIEEPLMAALAQIKRCVAA